MDPLSFGFIAWVVFLGGGIAYLADRLGRYLGKNRLRLFGLRPRHTAELLTLTAGALIPVFTVVILSVASKDVREWLIEGRKAIQKAQTYREEIAVQDAKLTAMRLEVGSATKELQKMRDEVATAKQARSTATIAAERQKEIANKAKGEALKLASSVKQSRSQLLVAQGNLNRTRGSLLFTQRGLTAAQNGLQSVQGNFNELNRQHSELLLENNRLLRETSDFERQRDDAKGQVEQAKKQLDDKLIELTNLTATFNKEKERLSADLDRIRDELEFNQEQLNKAEYQLNTAVTVSLTQPLIFHMGEELTRVPLRKQMNHFEAEAALRNVLGSARAVAAQRGAKANGMNGEAGLIPMKFQNSSEIISVEDQTNVILGELMNRDEETVLIIRSLYNAFQQGFVPLRVEIRDNPLVYKEGQLLAEARIDGTLRNEQILAQISEFLTSKVRAKVEADKLIPVSGRENSFAEVPPDEVIGIVNKIHDYKRVVRLQVYAKEDTRASGPLKIEFKIR